MRTVVDANVMLAALIRPGGWSDQQLRRSDVDWVVPELLVDEIADHIELLAQKTGEDVDEAAARVRQRLAGFQMVRTHDLLDHVDDVLVRVIERIDPDDRMYGAAVLATAARFLFTRDRDLLDAFPGLAVMHTPPSATLPDL